ncbi:MAG: tetratricopeptide repeat protein [Pirellulales bacterium]
MATKRKNRRRSKSTVDLLQKTRRHLEKGQYRDALKGAKACYRELPDAERRSLLEHVYMARIEQLSRNGHPEESRAGLQGLLDLGVTEPSVEAALPELLASVGLFERALQASDQGSAARIEEIPASIVDRGLLRPADIPASMGELREGVLRIHGALESLQAGEDEAACQQLRPISRRSPLADWRFFVRGLAAYYQCDTDAMRANWSRLDPERVAHRIAAPFQRLADRQNGRPVDGLARWVTAELERAAHAEPVLDILEKLRADMADDRWSELLRTLARGRAKLAAFNPQFLERIAAIVYYGLINAGDEELVEKASRLAPPLPIDPHWNRARAFFAEEADESPWEVERFWLHYLDDLKDVTCLSPDQRVLAKAMVLERLGRYLTIAVAEHEAMCEDPDCDATERLRERAVVHFRKSTELAPQLTSTWEGLAFAYAKWDEIDRAIETYGKLLDRDPRHLDALSFLADHYLQIDEPFEGLEFATRALRLRPLDPSTQTRVATLHLATARHFASRKDVRRGREAFAAAERVTPHLREEFQFLAKHAVFEFAVGDTDRARELADTAQNTLDEPTAPLLLMAIESIRYGQAPAGVDGYFEHEWRQTLKKRCRSQTAGCMARILNAFLVQDKDYPGLSRHAEAVVGYLARTSRVRWQVDDLRDVCEFLHLLQVNESGPSVASLLSKLARKGTKKFKDAACFHLAAGRAELHKGPKAGDLSRAVRSLRRAAELAGESSDPRDVEVAWEAGKTVRFARRMLMLSQLEQLTDSDQGVIPGEMRSRFGELFRMAGIDSEDVLEDIVDTAMPDP